MSNQWAKSETLSSFSVEGVKVSSLQNSVAMSATMVVLFAHRSHDHDHRSHRKNKLMS